MNNINVNHPTTSLKQRRKSRAISDVFEIQNLICLIFSYLDFKSWLQCSQVNKQWHHDSFHSTSLTHITTDDLCKMAQNRGSIKSKQNYLYNIDKFQKVQSLTVTRWDARLNKYFKNLDKFRNISKFDTDFGHVQEQTDIITKIVENNKNRLKNLTINNQYSRRSECKVLQSVFLPHLTILNVSNIIVQGFYLKKIEKSMDFGDRTVSNFDKLQQLDIHNSHLGIGFWHTMANYKISLSNINFLTLTRCQIKKNDTKFIESFCIPKIASKLTNLSHFRCSYSYPFDNTETCLSRVLGSFLHHLSHNERVRKSLKILVIDVVPQWFFNNQIIKNRMSNDACNYNLNFTNLKLVSVRFQASPLDESLKNWTSYSQKIVHKVLGIFCSEKQHSVLTSSDSCIDDSCGNNSVNDEDTAVKVKTETKHTLSIKQIYIFNI